MEENINLDELEFEDGYDDSGFEICPLCGATLEGEFAKRCKVYTTDGEEYENLIDTDPSEGPFICEDCQNNIHRSNHSTLSEW